MSEQQSKPDGVKYQIYIDERKSLVETENLIAHNFDKNIFTLAAGALGISLVFLEKFANNPSPQSLVLLYISWCALVLSLSTTLSSLLIGQFAYRRAREILEHEFFAKEANKANNRNCWARITQTLNWSSIVFFIIGVSTLALFGIQNMKSNLANQKTVSTMVNTSENGK